ncbi:MAG: LTA synthase family protein, partial [Chitinophagaceae bacterium]
NFMYSVVKRQSHITEENFFSDPELDKIITIKQKFEGRAFRKMNVMVFVMESFSYGFMDSSSHLYVPTPFLDSIRKESIWCENAYGTGYESNKGLFTIMTGIPPLIDEPVYYSPYSNLKFTSLGNILKAKGYSTHFFMGTEYDHFGFAKACKIAGLDHYHSSDEMKKEAIYDGYWGVYDHLYFKHAEDVIENIRQPFFATIFNVSTHHPYAVPDSLKEPKSKKSKRDDQISIQYFDHVLADFFSRLKLMPGYENTIFVFVADHSSPMRLRNPVANPMNLKIPLMIHIPGKKLMQRISKPVHQEDIVPSVLDLLGYSETFESFGKSVLDTSSNIIIWKKGEPYYSFDNKYLCYFNSQSGQVEGLYDLQIDRNMLHDLSKLRLETAKKHSDAIKALIQRYHHFLLKR